SPVPAPTRPRLRLRLPPPLAGEGWGGGKPESIVAKPPGVRSIFLEDEHADTHRTAISRSEQRRSPHHYGRRRDRRHRARPAHRRRGADLGRTLRHAARAGIA